MGLLFFVGLIVVIILWNNDRSAAKRREAQVYWRGRYDGRQVLRDQIEPLLSQSDDSQKIRGVIDSPDPAYGSAQGPAAAPVESVPSPAVAPGISAQPAAQPAQMAGVAASQTMATAPTQPTVVLDPEMVKQRRTAANLNILLYVGSFLIVAAVALLTNLSSPAWMKLSSMIVAATLFYATGLVLYSNSSRLRPAAIAFVGTGLAVVPFIGAALKTLGGLSAEWAWWTISLVGLAAYLVAALRLKSQVVSYLTMAFLLSLALSSVATLGVDIIWYFVVMIAVSLAVNTVHIIFPKVVPSVFSGAIRDTGIAVTPVALFASLLTIQAMDVWAYELLFGLATLHYVVVWLQSRQVYYEVLARVIGQITLLIVVGDLVQRQTDEAAVITFGIGWVMVALLQMGYSWLRIRMADKSSRQLEMSFIASMFGVMVLLLPVWAAVEQSASWLTLHLLIIGVAASATAMRLQQPSWLHGPLVVVGVLPFTVGRGIADPALDYGVIAGILALLAIGGLLLSERALATNTPKPWRVLAVTATSWFAGLVALTGLFDLKSLTIGWTMALAAGVFVMLSYVLRKAWVELVGAALAIVSVAGWTWQLVASTDWRWLVFVTVATGLLIAGGALHHQLKESKRRNGLVVLAASTLLLLIGVVAVESEAAVQAGVAIFLVASIGAFILRALRRSQNDSLSAVGLVGYLAYPLLALLMTGVLANAGMAVTLTLAVIALQQWFGSSIEKRASMLAIGHGAVVLAFTAMWLWLELSSDWALFGIFWLAAAAYYGFYWLAWSQTDQVRNQISFVAVMVALGVPALFELFSFETRFAVAGAASLIVAAAVLAGHGYLRHKAHYSEIAIYAATLAVQRLASLVIPDANVVFYAHWWAITLAAMALWRRDQRTRLMVGLGLVTLFSGVHALGEQGGYTWLFLVEHLIILVVGAVVRWQWMLWWGLIAVVLAVLYFLRDFTWLALLFLGFVIIMFVIWRLLKSSRQADPPTN